MICEEAIRVLTEMISSRCTPDIITKLNQNEVFVFGTDSEGKHKSSASELAVKDFGAKMGQGEGFSGQSYAIPVHKHRTWKMAEAVSRFIEFAKSNPDKNFLVLSVGCGAAGMDEYEVSLMFEKAIDVENIFLPRIFIKTLKDYYENGCSRVYNLKETVNMCLHSIQKHGFSPKGKIAMTRYYGFVLDDKGKQIFIGDETREDLKGLKSHSKIISIASTFSDEVGLTIDGRIISSIKSESSFSDFDLMLLRWECGKSSVNQMLKNLDKHQFDGFQNIKSISAGECHIAGVTYSGDVVCWDGQGGWEGAPDFKSMVKKWRNIKQVAVGYENIIALSNDGHVLGHGYCTDYSKYYGDYGDFIQVDAYGHYYGDTYSMALRKNGMVMSDSFEEVSAWHDIVQIAVGWDAAVGLRRDGGVNIVFYDDDVVKEVSSWTNIVNIECKFSQIIAISREGRIYSIKIH